jgi:hypothetical protein
MSLYYLTLAQPGVLLPISRMRPVTWWFLAVSHFPFLSSNHHSWANAGNAEHRRTPWPFPIDLPRR